MLTDEYRFWLALSGFSGGSSFWFGLSTGYLIAHGSWLFVATWAFAMVSWIVSLIAWGVTKDIIREERNE